VIAWVTETLYGCKRKSWSPPWQNLPCTRATCCDGRCVGFWELFLIFLRTVAVRFGDWTGRCLPQSSFLDTC
jgi:hypothetical protein